MYFCGLRMHPHPHPHQSGLEKKNYPRVGIDCGPLRGCPDNYLWRSRGRTVALTVAVTSVYPCSTQITPTKSDIGYHLSSVWSWGEKLKPPVNSIQYNVQCAKGHFTSHFVSFLPAILCLCTSLYQGFTEVSGPVQGFLLIFLIFSRNYS